MQISQHFTRQEFRCRCCNKATADHLLVEALEDCRSHFKTKYPKLDISIKITSGHRCVNHNANVGGAAKSKHLDGIAVDFIVRGVAADDVATYLEKQYPDKYGIGRYTGRTHLDVREEKARWDRRGL